jgi:REP element-mobilizing transposase RayT
MTPCSRDHEPPLPEPLGYLITWTTYGSWLPGDERGWVLVGHGPQPADAARKQKAQDLMTEEALVLDQEQRELVDKTVAEHCRIRNWDLHIVNCRTNHVHIVVTADCDPEIVRDQLKAWCTRRLKELARKNGTQVNRRTGKLRLKWWTEGGSIRALNYERALEDAIEYVRDQ